MSCQRGSSMTNRAAQAIRSRQKYPHLNYINLPPPSPLYKHIVSITPACHRCPAPNAVKTDFEKQAKTARCLFTGELYSTPQYFSTSSISAAFPVPSIHPAPCLSLSALSNPLTFSLECCIYLAKLISLIKM